MNFEIEQVLAYLPKSIASYLKTSSLNLNAVTEIRVRENAQTAVTIAGQNIYIPITITETQIQEIFLKICGYSIPTYEKDISQGFVTIEGGHRVGIGGEYYFNVKDNIYILKRLMSLNFRIAKESAKFAIEKYINNFDKSVLITGKTHSGKTTFIKNYLECLVNLNNRVVVCDERNEIYIKNISCDCIKGMEKSQAITLATRTLNPQFIICDEIGNLSEAKSILSAVNTGTKFICSAHGESIDMLYRRPNIKILLKACVFERIIILQQNNSVFSIGDIIDV